MKKIFTNTIHGENASKSIIFRFVPVNMVLSRRVNKWWQGHGEMGSAQQSVNELVQPLWKIRCRLLKKLKIDHIIQ